MVSGVAGEPGATFFALTPDRVLDAVEVGGLRCTGRCLPLRAFENRVYEVELEDERRLVVKFYRPGRWSRETILDEHAFLADLADAEVPAVAPIDLGTGGDAERDRGHLLRGVPEGPRALARRARRGESSADRPNDRPHARGRRLARRAEPPAGRPSKRYILEPLEVLDGRRLHSRGARAALPRRGASGSPKPRSSRSPRRASSASTATCTGATSSGRPIRSWSTSTTVWSARPSRTSGSWRAATPRRRGSCARICWRATSSSASSTARRSPCASRYARCASSTCRAGSRDGGAIRRFRPRFPMFRNHNYWNQEYEELVQIAEGLA